MGGASLAQGRVCFGCPWNALAQGYLTFSCGTGLCGASGSSRDGYRFALGVVPIACRRGGQALPLLPKPQLCLDTGTPCRHLWGGGPETKPKPGPPGSLTFQHSPLSLGRASSQAPIPPGQMSQTLALPDTAVVARIPAQSNSTGRGRDTSFWLEVGRIMPFPRALRQVP